MKKITVRGVVQGVGFRPFVYRLAHDHGLTGWVLNHSAGVDIEVEGPPDALAAFVHDLSAQAPPLAHIESITVEDGPPAGYDRFEIRHSVARAGQYQLISPDIATCDDCRRELLDPADRRYRYPFTNCTNCGPRFTIIADVPYDRPLTTMRDFVMCPACQAEYDDPLDRRFHAQPNACPVCGPHVWIEPAGEGMQNPLLKGGASGGADELQTAAHLLRQGAILAIKGLGGFHLACDATNAAAVNTLRQRKGRPSKPLAVMMATLDDVRRHCHVSPTEEALLTSPQCPIVLLPWRREASDVVEAVAPRHRYLGVMLPYTPLHHVLLRDVGRPLVMTSGNLSEEPIAQDNDEARRRLGHLADYFVLHDRAIYARYDDSVWFVPLVPAGNQQPATSHPQPIRRSRGYAPFPIKLPFRAGHILACGAELKNTFCLTRDEYAFLSQHIGDLENLETLEHFETTIELYKRLFRVEPDVIAYDLHPEYLSTKYARSHIAYRVSHIAHRVSHIAYRVSHIGIQHHHAHVAACLADNGWQPDGGPVIGVSWDGTGYGPDGHIWGGEWLVADYRGFRRAAHFEYLPMPGGQAAIERPYRLAVGYLYHLLGHVPDLPFRAAIDRAELDIITQQIERGLNTPLTSSAGRLFDAVAALTGVRGRASYEAQAAIELEMVAGGKLQVAGSKWDVTDGNAYPFSVRVEKGVRVVEVRALFEGIIADLRAGVPVAEIGLRFHNTLARLIGEMCQAIAAETGVRTVALSGGCFQNRLLFGRTVAVLREAGFRVLTHRRVPCNDGGLSLGQAAIAHFLSE